MRDNPNILSLSCDLILSVSASHGHMTNLSRGYHVTNKQSIANEEMMTSQAVVNPRQFNTSVWVKKQLTTLCEK